jgi:hypothetical protein
MTNPQRISLAGAVFALALAALAWAADEVDWNDAAGCVGEVCSVRGRVVEVSDDGTAIRLYFDRDRRDVCVTLVRSWLVSWPDYAGREITAKGPVRRFRDLTEVAVLDPSAIVLVDGEPTPAIELESPARREAEELRDEIRRLEQRVRELESR